MNHSTSRLETSIEEMKEFYPQFSLSGAPIGTGPVAVWTGSVQPVQTCSNLVELLDDISCDRPVEIFHGGRVGHLADCRARHDEREWMEELTNPYMPFKLEVRYGGDSVHPRSYVVFASVAPIGVETHFRRRGGLSVCSMATCLVVDDALSSRLYGPRSGVDYQIDSLAPGPHLDWQGGQTRERISAENDPPERSMLVWFRKQISVMSSLN